MSLDFLRDPTFAWVSLAVFVVVSLAVDMIIHRKSHELALKEALVGSAFWVSLGLLFNLAVFLSRGPQAGTEFLTGYIIELSLSVDNLFVFMVLFRYFRVPAAFQHRVLFWGIFGAVVMRLIFVFAGVALLERFHWLMYVFGAILVWSGIKMFTQHEVEVHPEKNPILRLFARFVPMTADYERDRFFVKRAGVLMATPLVMVLIMIEITDLVFAVDSIPAVLAVTRDPFIVFSSNIFAVLGLRALFFSLNHVMKLFHYLHYGLAGILAFIGVKMILSDLIHMPTWLALGVVVVTLVGCIVASLIWPQRSPLEEPAPTGPPPHIGPDGDS
ncbi:MAG: TerC family protein [Candidatus Eisenbacteria bacterium]|uniref:TerC family protein n=1 Tax=Eiseniibacteriota bacterium TaxID=2212470 RepID=A0A849SH68_UNCEI|nr:TerC family protein [Candidatus Eisenbacteria bacterium]